MWSPASLAKVRVRWKRRLEDQHGEFVVKYGYSSSPLLWAGKLYVVVMQNKQADRYHASPRTGALEGGDRPPCRTPRYSRRDRFDGSR